ncbi:MAG: hypothetical protein ACJ748_07165 [Flavisolibacter sp.]
MTRSTLLWICNALLFASVAFTLSFLFFHLKKGCHFDDAYMFMRYADNIINHHVYGWNPGERAFGCTSMVYTFFEALLKCVSLLVGFQSSVRNDGTILILSSFSWGMLSLWLMYKIIGRINRESFAIPQEFIRITFAFILFSAPFNFNLTTGMDTMASVFFNTLVIYAAFLVTRNSSLFNIIKLSFAIYLAFLTRPDSIILNGTFSFLVLIYFRVPAKKLLSFLGSMVLILGADTLIKYLYFGNPLPLPFYVKKGGFYEGFMGVADWNAVDFFLNFIYNYGIYFIIPGMFLDKWNMRAYLVFLLPLLLFFGYFFTVLQIMGNQSRFYVPGLPYIIIGAFYFLASIEYTKYFKGSFVLPVLFTLIIIAILTFSYPYKFYLLQKETNKEMAITGEQSTNKPKLNDFEATEKFSWLIKDLPSGSVVAATEHGYPSAANPEINILDLSGLHNPYFIRHGWTNDIIKSQMPEVIWMPHTNYTVLRYRIAHDSTFQKDYTYFPGAINFGIAIKKNSPFYNNLTGKLSLINNQFASK